MRYLLKRIFRVIDIDAHYHVFLFGIHVFAIKHKHINIIPNLVSIEAKNVCIDHKIVVSITSFPERVYNNCTAKAIKTLLSQTIKPDFLVLWLADSQFGNRENDLPADLLDLKNYGLNIEWCENIGSYKKLIPALKKYPKDIIITVDDDICYAPDTIETLYKSYLKSPQNVHAHRCGRVVIKDNILKNVPTCYLFDKKYEASFLNRLTGNAGVLYPPNIFSELVFKDFQKILPTHDDIWFWGMLVLNGVKTQVVKGYSESVYPIDNSQQFGLCKINSNSGAGMSINEAYKKFVKFYPEIIRLLQK